MDKIQKGKQERVFWLAKKEAPPEAATIEASLATPAMPFSASVVCHVSVLPFSEFIQLPHCGVVLTEDNVCLI
jgi:hypothetical protein